MRVFLAAFGDAGHVFPVTALACALRDRGHDVTVETYVRWQPDIEREGLGFVAAAEFPPPDSGGRWFLPPFLAAEQATPVTREALRALQPDLVVSDILTIAPPLAAELEGIPVATLIPHVDPRPHRGHPPYSLGARLPRTAVGRAWWTLLDPLVRLGGRIGRDELNATRQNVGLPPLAHIHNGISARLAIVATFPQLEYPRRMPEPNTHVVGPLQWEPQADPVDLPRGDPSWPLVLVAPSTAQDPDARLLRAAAAGLADLPIRLLITTNHRPPEGGLSLEAPNVRVVDWLSYAQTMPQADVVVCHGGHGTMTRALASGAVPVVWPAWGDMGENAARLAWAGAGVRIPRRFLTAGTLRLAVLEALSDRRLHERAGALRDWIATNDPARTAAALVEDAAHG